MHTSMAPSLPSSSSGPFNGSPIPSTHPISLSLSRRLSASIISTTDAQVISDSFGQPGMGGYRSGGGGDIEGGVDFEGSGGSLGPTRGVERVVGDVFGAGGHGGGTGGSNGREQRIPGSRHSSSFGAVSPISPPSTTPNTPTSHEKTVKARGGEEVGINKSLSGEESFGRTNSSSARSNTRSGKEKENTEVWGAFERPGSSPIAESMRREPLSRIVTTLGPTFTPCTGSTPSPLNSSRSNSPNPYLRPSSPSPPRDSPSHSTVSLPTSSSLHIVSPTMHRTHSDSLYPSALYSIASSSTSSLPPRPHSSLGSTSLPMDRIATSSNSWNSHNRNYSLTSACAPVTASSHGSTSNLGQYPPTVSAQGSPGAQQRSWKNYDWGGSNEGTPIVAQHSIRDPMDVRKPAKSFPSPSYFTTVLSLPTTLLSFFLSPLSSAQVHHHSPTLNGSTAPTSKVKRWPLPIRLVTTAYLIFATLFFGIQIAGWSTGRPSTRFGIKGSRLGPRADGMGNIKTFKSPFTLSRVGGMGEWAYRVAEGVSWGRAAGEGEMEVVGSKESTVLSTKAMDVAAWGTVRRIGDAALQAQVPATNPLTGLTHTYRFAKMHEKISGDQHDEIEPYLFRATSTPSPDDITACLYSNEAWLSHLPAFVHAWGGPVSLVFEASHSRFSPRRAALVSSIKLLRGSDSLVRKLVDFHIVGIPLSTSERSANRTRERLISRPLALNFHINLARFFAPTDIIFMVGDARMVPSTGLRKRIMEPSIRDLVLERGDAVVVPTFGFIRDSPGNSLAPPTLHSLREKLDLPIGGQWDGVSEFEFDLIAAENLVELHKTLPLSPDQWPQKKSSLVPLVSHNTRSSSPNPPPPSIALHDRRWELNHGPTNWYLWRKSPSDAHLDSPPDQGGGIGLGVEGTLGGGTAVYKVIDYDLHYAPNVVMSNRGQPWCTERFENMQAACVYQMYLSGAELWVLPDQWIYTLEVMEKGTEETKVDPAEKLKNSISSRLFGKFHQEACMHYGREFLSMPAMWDSEKAQHLRSTCARTLGSWGMGLVVV